MWTRRKKTMMAIEWVWLLIGTAAVFAHLVEAWASPYLPALWMLGVIVLFMTYRVGIAVREVYWPEPEPEPESDTEQRVYETATRRGGDGMVSTTEWVPPHIRGRNVPKERRRQRAQNGRRGPDAQPSKPKKIQLPSASGRFEAEEIVTVFAHIDEDTEPEPTGVEDDAIPFQATSIVRVDTTDLRPETAADISTSDVSVPSFAESQLTGEQRKRALEALRDQETRRRQKPARDQEVTDTKPTPKPPPLTKDISQQDDTNPDDTAPIHVRNKLRGSDKMGPQ